MRIGVAIKWVDQRPEIDLLTAAVHDDDRSSGASAADLAALEWALRCADAWGPGVEVLVVTAGPSEADAELRDALAAGATRVLRVDLTPSAESEAVAHVLADALDDCDAVWCGDYSLDRGSGSVPAYLAAHLGAAQALGLVQVSLGAAGSVDALRRLDGGRRERLRVRCPAVLSVEGSTARLRRASLAASLRSRDATVEVVAGPTVPVQAARVAHPFRPRSRSLPPPAGATALERILAITDAHGPSAAAGEPVVLEPAAAADRILDALAAWGYRPAP
jgi:electron transfer flavoprotein beta subunit